MSKVFVTVLLLGATTGGTTPGLKWSHDYGKAMLEAKEAQRPMLVVIENPQRAEESIDEAALVSDPRQRELLGNVHLCRVDVNTEYGRKVARAFGVSQLPYTAVTDRQVRVLLFRKAGPMQEADWSRALSTVQTGRVATPTIPVQGSITQGPIILDSGYSAPLNSFFYPSTCPSCVR